MEPIAIVASTIAADAIAIATATDLGMPFTRPPKCLGNQRHISPLMASEGAATRTSFTALSNPCPSFFAGGRGLTSADGWASACSLLPEQ
jgi:hypothetical protein